MCGGGEKLYVIKTVFQKHDIDAFWLYWNMLLPWFENFCQGPEVFTKECCENYKFLNANLRPVLLTQVSKSLCDP